ncbi:MAG TPA: DEAD/DEAH box helicase [Jatrophihabitans sp.]|uniref:DEAD/DEAH box helicase n=1 Tax=Jatrophihabitans sp. TaxID=1932789 RepID=UPI002E07365D|nr:DEAD/DEAH box helicase [Jatrophihabitans sp.]
MPSSTSRGSAAPRSGARRRPSTRSSSAGSAPRRPAASRTLWDRLPVSIVPTENLPGFAELGLPATIVKALARHGIPSPFPIQAATIPDVLAGRDLLGRAATGSGKTLAFGLPLIGRLSGPPSAPRRPRGLVLVPTRELAMQVTDALAPLASACGVSVRLVAGGLAINKQIQSLERGVDILVATPGRLEDLIDRRACYLDSVETTVLDEADHMADLGFLPVVRRLLNQTPSDGQRLLFSATLDGDVATLIEEYLTDPSVHALSTAEASVDTMTHHVFRVSHESKFDVLAEIVAREGRTIGFVRTKHGADRVAKNLGRIGVRAGVLHGGRSQSQRNRALEAFRDGSVPVLIATDVAARGIHVDDVSLVLHVDPPADPKDYLHRSGRTARAGESGVVVVLSTPADERDVRKMLGAAGVRPEERTATVGDADVARVTGARTPSGVALVEARPAKPVRPRADGSAPHPPRSGGRRGGPGRSGGATRSGSTGGAAAFSAQRGDGRPRRTRRPS